MPVLLSDRLDFNALADIRQPLPWLLGQYARTADIRAAVCEREGDAESAAAYAERANAIRVLSRR